MLLFYTDTANIYRMELQSSPGKEGWPLGYPNDTVSHVIVNDTRVTVLAVDAVARKVVWYDHFGMNWCNFDGTEREVLFRFAVASYVHGLVVDSSSGQLYLTDMINNVVLRSDICGKSRHIVAYNRHSQPFRLAISVDNK